MQNNGQTRYNWAWKLRFSEQYGGQLVTIWSFKNSSSSYSVGKKYFSNIQKCPTDWLVVTSLPLLKGPVFNSCPCHWIFRWRYLLTRGFYVFVLCPCSVLCCLRRWLYLKLGQDFQLCPYSNIWTTVTSSATRY